MPPAPARRPRCGHGAVSPGITARPDVPPAARADFDRAVKYLRAGNATEAELGFKQVALQYPQFAAPLVDLALLQRKQGELEQAEATLKSAVAHESGNRARLDRAGCDAKNARPNSRMPPPPTSRRSPADPHYAPAWRNLGVLADLYLGDPQRALSAFEKYKAITQRGETGERLDCRAPPAAGHQGPGSQPAGPGRCRTGQEPASAPAPAVPAPPESAAPANAAAIQPTARAGG